MTVKVIGNPTWNWTYEYPDLGLNEDGSAKVSFTAYLKPRTDAARDNVPYLLATDVPVVVPVNKIVKMIMTSDPEGIIHAWTIPSFGMKIDAIPGRLNEDWFKATREGALLRPVLRAVRQGPCLSCRSKCMSYREADFAAWAEKIKTASAEEARDYLFAMLKAKGQLAQN